MTLTFKLPIETTKTPHYELDKSILKDLEVLETKNEDDVETKSLFDIIYEPTHKVDNIIKERLMTCYTTDISFLKQKQQFIKQVGKLNLVKRSMITETFDAIDDIINEQDFHSKYQFIEINMFKSLNQNQHFMQMLSFYNMFSPLITLLTPIVIIIIPFFLIRYQGIKLSFSTYFSTIKHVLKNHAIGKLFDSFGSISWEKRVYLLISIAFYILQIYQNALSCYRFTVNMKHIHKNIFCLKDYINNTCQTIRSLNEITSKLDTFSDFTLSNDKCLQILEALLEELETISPLRITPAKATQIGHVMRIYYNLKFDEDISSAINYSFYLNSYLNAMIKISNIKQINNATFTITNTWETRNMIYPHHYHNNKNKNKTRTIGNSFNIKKPILLTGPNASGKTTLLKSALLNTILSQQIGCGFYEKLIIKPYTNFHCYLDVPDTSGRDSLFQAEARRCLNIINSISKCKKNNKTDKRFFCIFDELYSGTNPTEAVASSYAFIKLLSKYNNVNFLLTSHFYDLCTLCEKYKLNIRNNQMSWKYENNHTNKIINIPQQTTDVIFTYKMNKGISTLRGGVRVLKQLNYPSSVINDASLILKEYV